MKRAARAGRGAGTAGRRAQRRLLGTAALLAPLGVATKLYTGPGRAFVQGYAGGVLYVAFWIVTVLAIRPAWRPRTVAAAVVLVTGLLEALQLWHPPWLEAVRATFVGHALLGSQFSLLDYPFYLLGGLAGGLLGDRLRGRARAGPHAAGPHDPATAATRGDA